MRVKGVGFSSCPRGLCGPSAGVPFRETHHMSGAAVKMAEDKGCQLSDLTVADLATINPLFTDDVVEVRASGRWRSGRGGGQSAVLRVWLATRSGISLALVVCP